VCIVRLTFEHRKAPIDPVVTDASWRASETAEEGWQTAGFKDASWDAARLRRRLRRLGVRRRVVAVERETTGWGALTAAELAVSDLAAEGMTNKQIAEKLFISPHTVNTHLRHVFEKLGLRSRLALSKAAEHQRRLQ